jgi:membrane protein required for colicin V production
MNGLQTLDFVVFAVLVVSGLFAFMRGFVHEALSLGGWIGSIFTVLYGLPLVRPLTRSLISTSWLADVAAAALLFVGALVVFSLLTHAVSRRVRESQLGFLDRTLGFGFGLLRGSLIVCLAWLVIGWVVVIDEQGSWIREAKTRSLLQQGANIMISVAPAHLGEFEKNTKEAASKAQEAAAGKQALDQLIKPEPKMDQDRPGKGYDTKDRSDLDRLIQSK